MSKNIAFHKINTDNNEIDEITNLLQSESSIGKVLELENKIKSILDSEYVISTNNETSALHLALSSMDLKRADKVLMSVNSFPNLPETVRHFDAEPIFIDIEDNNLNIDLGKLENYLEENNSKKLRAIIVSFVAGEIPDLNRLYLIKEKYNVVLIENAGNIIGSTYNGKVIGNIEADMTIFTMNSSHNKNLLSNAAFISTNNEVLAKRALLLRTHALDECFDSFGNLECSYDVIDIGYKYDMSEIEGAFNIAQLKKIPTSLKRRKEIANIYLRELADVAHVTLPNEENNELFTQFIIKIDKNRDSFAKTLQDRGVATGITYIPLHLMSYYKQKYKLKITAFNNALKMYSQILSLPIYSSLSNEDVQYICDNIKKIANEWI